MSTVDFWVSGCPKAQPRPRAFARRIGNKFVARVHNPADAEGWKGCIAIAAREHAPTSPAEGPIRLDIDVFFARPKCLNRKCDPPNPIPHTSRPDVDNLAKAIQDCLTVLGFYRDDAQVCDSRVRKFYAAKDGKTGARIRMSTLTEGTA